MIPPQFKEMTLMYLQMSDVLLLEIYVQSQRNVFNGFRDCLHTIYAVMNCLGFQKFPEASLSQLWCSSGGKLPVKPIFGKLWFLQALARYIGECVTFSLSFSFSLGPKMKIYWKPKCHALPLVCFRVSFCWAIAISQISLLIRRTAYDLTVLNFDVTILYSPH